MKRSVKQLESLLRRKHPSLSVHEKVRLQELLSLQYQEVYPHSFQFRVLPGLFASAIVTALLIIGVVRISNHNTSLQSISNDLDHVVIEDESFL